MKQICIDGVSCVCFIFHFSSIIITNFEIGVHISHRTLSVFHAFKIVRPRFMLLVFPSVHQENYSISSLEDVLPVPNRWFFVEKVLCF